MGVKHYHDGNVYDAAKERIAYVFDNFPRIYVSFSGGKDSTTMIHMVMDEAKRRNRRVGVLVIDLEAQYSLTIQHMQDVCEMYGDLIDLHWVCLPLLLRNAVTQYKPQWCCWDPGAKEQWVREIPDMPGVVSDPQQLPFFIPRMEFEEFMALFGEWYSNGEETAALVGIRCDESLNRFRTIASKTKTTHNGHRFTTLIGENVYNVYPLYDWKTEDIWVYHAHHPDKPHNALYDRMHMAGVPLHSQRICQPYGDDQRRGLWLFHLIEPQTWSKVVARVNGANSGALYIQETGNITGYNKIAKPQGHTWKTFCELLLSSLPGPTQAHYVEKFRKFIGWWKWRGYADGIPDEAPKLLESQGLAPSYRRLCKVLLRNDWWCKGLKFSQPKSEAYGKYLELKKSRKAS